VAPGSTFSSRPAAASSVNLWDTLVSDAKVVAEDLRRHGVDRSVRGTLVTLEAFYINPDDRRRLATMKPAAQWLHRIWWFTKGLLLKLTPARRLMLAVALVISVFGEQRFSTGTTRIVLSFSVFAGWLLFLILVLELKDKLLARDELEAGRKVQLALMPTQSPRIPGWDVWLYTQPANDVGGDLVDHLPLGGDRHAIALGDVAGKALPAALLSVKLQATLRALAPQCATLSRLGEEVNQIFCRDGLPSRFASLVYLDVRTGSGDVRVLNAGHMPPIVVRRANARVMERGSVVLGIMDGAAFPEQLVTLEPGDALIVYSDGASEAINEAGDFFGDERIMAIAERANGDSANAIGEQIRSAVATFTGLMPANDDLSLMVIKRLQF